MHTIHTAVTTYNNQEAQMLIFYAGIEAQIIEIYVDGKMVVCKKKPT